MKGIWDDSGTGIVCGYDDCNSHSSRRCVLIRLSAKMKSTGKKKSLWRTGSIHFSHLYDELMGGSERISEEYMGRLGRFDGVINPIAGIRYRRGPTSLWSCGILKRSSGPDFCHYVIVCVILYFKRLAGHYIWKNINRWITSQKNKNYSAQPICSVASRRSKLLVYSYLG